MKALELSEDGLREQDIASILDASQSAVSQWLKAARYGGRNALRSHSPPGWPSRLTAAEKALLPDFLWHGPEAYGFRGEGWTCPRVAKVLAEELEVSYSRSQVSRLLRDLGWSRQTPLKRALQRNEAAIERWRCETWPVLKRQAHRERRTLVFIDESGFYLLPGVVKTYAPKGLTPILREWQTRDHLSVMGALTLKGKAYALVPQESLNGLHTIAFLNHLLCVIGPRLLVIWDDSPIHRRTQVQEFLSTKAATGIRIEPLPAYAPDLNPVEWLWRCLKQVELRNKACLDLEELHMEFHLALGRVRQKPELIRSFFEGARLTT